MGRHYQTMECAGRCVDSHIQAAPRPGSTLVALRVLCAVSISTVSTPLYGPQTTIASLPQHLVTTLSRSGIPTVSATQRIAGVLNECALQNLIQCRQSMHIATRSLHAIGISTTNMSSYPVQWIRHSRSGSPLKLSQYCASSERGLCVRICGRLRTK